MLTELVAPTWLTVLEVGPLVTVQDRGRTGLAHLGVPRGGALDAPAAALANRLVGNDLDAAVLEVLLGGLRVRNEGPGRWAALTGARAALAIDDVAQSWSQSIWWGAGSTLSLEVPSTGLRSYLAVAGGIDVEPVLGSRSTDTLAWLGPAPVRAGATLPVGVPRGAPRALDLAPPRPRAGLRFVPGPRAAWVASLRPLTETAWRVLPDSDRIGLRLDGPPLRRVRSGSAQDGDATTGVLDELPSEGMVLGAVQLPPDGRPVVFLADHPVTGGYPVVAVVDVRDLWQCAQARPGEETRFVAAR